MTRPKPLHVQLYATPGTGKTSTALGLAHALKLRGAHCELVAEYAKDLVYAGTLSTTPQSAIFAEQYRRQKLYNDGGVDIIITDSPVALSLAYCTPEERAELSIKARECVKDWDCLSILLHRDLRQSYQAQGRGQTMEEAIEFGDKVFNPWVRSWEGSSLIEHTITASTLDDILALINLRLHGPN